MYKNLDIAELLFFFEMQRVSRTSINTLVNPATLVVKIKLGLDNATNGKKIVSFPCSRFVNVNKQVKDDFDNYSLLQL